MRAAVSFRTGQAESAERRPINLVSRRQEPRYTRPLYVVSPCSMPCFEIPPFYPSVKSLSRSKLHRRRCSRTRNPTRRLLLFMTSSKSSRVHVWTRSVGIGHRMSQQGFLLSRRIGRRRRRKLPAVLVSFVVLLGVQTSLKSLAPETVDDYSDFLRELGIGGQAGLTVPTNPFADSLWDLAVFSPGGEASGMQ
jgi:hypothetical protein